MTQLELFIQGGPLMFVLGALSVMVVAISLAKFYQFYRCGIYRQDSIEELESRLQTVACEEVEKVIQTIDDGNPLQRVIKVALRCFAHPNFSFEIARAEISRAASAEIQNLEVALKTLSSIAYLSPLIGLLGTVLGMIKAFASLESAGRAVSPSLLAGGIWEALLTTALGLAIAIVALAFQYYFDAVIDKLKLRLASDITKIQTVLAKSGWSLAVESLKVSGNQS